MKPAPFSYHAPKSLDEAVSLLATLDNARLLAGGQSLMPMLNFRLTTPSHLIDLNRVAGLRGIAETADGIRIGAMTTQRSVERSAVVRARCPLLLDALAHVGHQQTRNRGTIGGSLCHLDPAAELPIVAMALDATLTAASGRGRRRIAFADFPAGILTSQLAPDEMVTEVDFPGFAPGTVWGFEEFSRRPADFAIVAVAVALTPDSEGYVRAARIAIGGLGDAPRRIGTAEAALIGQRLEPDSIAAAAAAAADSAAEGDDNNPAEYRRQLAGVLTGRCLAKAAARGREGVRG